MRPVRRPTIPRALFPALAILVLIGTTPVSGEAAHPSAFVGLATDGERFALAVHGEGSALASHGDGFALAVHGEGSALASHGDGFALAVHGEGSALASHGEGFALTTHRESFGVAVDGERIDLAHAALAAEIPYFARRYGLECSRCHISPPKLNEFGEAFARGNYRFPEPDPETRRTVPFALWVSGRSDLPPSTAEEARSFRSYINRVEVVSGGALLPWLSFFVEWRPVSFELQPDRSLRDRSGRFEDLFLTATRGGFELSAGQFRQVQQVDISRRLGVNEPAFFSRSLAGTGGSSPREQALRGFSLSGRSPSVRAGWVQNLTGGWEWTTYASLPFPGELSLPLTREARTQASFEFSPDPKGVFLESFVRRGMTSYGAHVFVDPGDRYQAALVATGRRGPWMWTGAGGGARGPEGSVRGRWSLEGEYVLTRYATVGGRGEGHAGLDPAFVTYGNVHFPGTTYTLRLTLEQRIQAGRGTTLLELGAVF